MRDKTPQEKLEEYAPSIRTFYKGFQNLQSDLRSTSDAEPC